MANIYEFVKANKPVLRETQIIVTMNNGDKYVGEYKGTTRPVDNDCDEWSIVVGNLFAYDSQIKELKMQ